ncbi:MAG: Arc family DNA-binding protein [Kiloniellales bacterium]
MTTITLKNIPDDLYERLKQQAQAHRRSVNSELIHCLETVLRPKRITAEERLARIRSLRPRIDPKAVSEEDVLEAIDEGRS